jgi:hypothetical protein
LSWTLSCYELVKMYKDIWTWEKSKLKINTLRGRLGFADSPRLEFLKLTLFLETGQIKDEIRKQFLPDIETTVYFILSGYAKAQPKSETHKLISFSQLPGGQSYNNAFIRRAVQPIEETFGSNAEGLWTAAKPLDAERLGYGDCSVKIYSLPFVPIVIILHGSTDEFSASASILFDSSASNYLSTEQMATLGGLTSARLRHAHEAIA